MKRAGVSPSSHITGVFFEFPSRNIKNISKKPADEIIIINKTAVLLNNFLFELCRTLKACFRYQDKFKAKVWQFI